MRGSLQHPTVLDKASFVIYKSSNFVNYKSSVLLVVDGRRGEGTLQHHGADYYYTSHWSCFFLIQFYIPGEITENYLLLTLPHLAPNS